jgi:hypothetical protein
MVVLTSAWPSKFLHGADVVAGLQQVGGERVAQGVWRGQGRLDARTPHRALEGALERLVVQVMPPLEAAARVERQGLLREDPEPAPGRTRARELARQCIGHLHARHPGRAIGRPQQPRTRQMLAQRQHQRARQHERTVLAALAAAHDQGAALEVHVLGAQLQGLGDAHARAVQQLRQQAMDPVELREHARHLVVREDRGQPGLPPRAADGLHPRQIHAEHLLVQEQQRRERLPVRGHRDAPLGRQPGEKGLHLRRPHVARVRGTSVEADERANPEHVSLLGAQAVVKVAHALAHLVEQPRGL